MMSLKRHYFMIDKYFLLSINRNNNKNKYNIKSENLCLNQFNLTFFVGSNYTHEFNSSI
jgi:hypothetical protein